MVREYVKGTKKPLGKGLFSTLDFDCRCQRLGCIETLIDDDLVTALEELVHSTYGIYINDGYRCPVHNKEVGGLEDSQHLLGKAADIRGNGFGPKILAASANRIALFLNGGIGIYDTFVHVDVRVGKARWTQGEKNV